MLHEIVGWPGPMTHRQFRTWQEWLRRQWNEPSRTDHYIMRVAAEFLRSVVTNPHAITLESMKIPFGPVNGKPKLTDGEINVIVANSLARAGGSKGKEARVKMPDGSYVPISQYKGPL